ncbi:FliH/SctL family protein [Porticoccaceae bacterium LTM1]|nr:FliH/SctL family protein [Porticoccaceae bacterium LTM1]
MPKIISGDQTTEFKKWDVPSVNSSQGSTLLSKDGLSGTEPSPEPEAPSPITQQEREAIEKQAHAKGYQMGRWEGMNAGREELEKQGEQFKKLCESLSNPLAKLDEEVQRELVLLAGAMAGQLVRRELSVNPDILNNIVASAVTALRTTSRRVHIYLNPVDAALVADILSSPDPEQHWQVVESPELREGDVRVEANNAHIDLSMRSRLYHLVGNLLNSTPEHIADEIDPVLDSVFECDNCEQNLLLLKSDKHQ